MYSFPRYLQAKRTVDDRALNRVVWQSLQHAFHQIEQPRILEIGGGTGAMLQRMVEWGLLANGHYTLLDAEAENIADARRKLPGWGCKHGLTTLQEDDRLSFSSLRGRLNLDLVTGDLFDFIEASTKQSARWDLLVAHAFLDLVNIPRTLALLRGLLNPGGLLYLTINFDGLTAFEPMLDACLDEKIIGLYHQSMDERDTGGDSRSGRHMFRWLPQAGFAILAAGSSDWAVFPKHGVYPADEKYFLHFILHFFENSLSGHPALAAEPFKEWLAERRAQVECGELVYLAHQFDFLAVIE
jgi:hypothetical protein